MRRAVYTVIVDLPSGVLSDEMKDEIRKAIGMIPGDKHPDDPRRDLDRASIVVSHAYTMNIPRRRRT